LTGRIFLHFENRLRIPLFFGLLSLYLPLLRIPLSLYSSVPFNDSPPLQIVVKNFPGLSLCCPLGTALFYLLPLFSWWCPRSPHEVPWALFLFRSSRVATKQTEVRNVVVFPSPPFFSKRPSLFVFSPCLLFRFLSPKEFFRRKSVIRALLYDFFIHSSPFGPDVPPRKAPSSFFLFSFPPDVFTDLRVAVACLSSPSLF